MLTDAGQAQVYDFNDNQVPGETERDHGYWRDVGTLDSYYDAHMDLISDRSPSSTCTTGSWPIFTHCRRSCRRRSSSPAASRASPWSAPAASSRGQVTQSVLSPGVVVEEGAVVQGSVLHDGVRIGRGAVVRGAILDKNVVVPAGCPHRGERRQHDRELLHRLRGRHRRAGQGADGPLSAPARERLPDGAVRRRRRLLAGHAAHVSGWQAFGKRHPPNWLMSASQKAGHASHRSAMAGDRTPVAGRRGRPGGASGPPSGVSRSAPAGPRTREAYGGVARVERDRTRRR